MRSAGGGAPVSNLAALMGADGPPDRTSPLPPAPTLAASTAEPSRLCAPLTVNWTHILFVPFLCITNKHSTRPYLGDTVLGHSTRPSLSLDTGHAFDPYSFSALSTQSTSAVIA